MKRTAIILVSVLLLFLLSLIPFIREEVHWLWANIINNKTQFENFITNWPGSRHIDKAQSLFDNEFWETTFELNTISAYNDYLKTIPSGKFEQQAKQKIESLVWDSINKSNKIKDYLLYLETYPNGSFQSDARGEIQKLKKDVSIYDKVIKEGSAKSIEQFLDEYPGHIYEIEARSILKDIEGRDLEELVRENKISVSCRGNDIQSISLSLSKKVSHPIKVIIQPGCYFTTGSAQNMVVTDSVSVFLDENYFKDIKINAACAQMYKPIPDYNNEFALSVSGSSSSLKQLMKTINRYNGENLKYEELQAAVWIITDNADYCELGRLKEGYGTNSSRKISSHDAAMALYLVGKSGVNIKNKKIWNNRALLYSSTNRTEVKEYLGEQDIALNKYENTFSMKAEKILKSQFNNNFEKIKDPKLNVIIWVPVFLDYQTSAEAGWIRQFLTDNGHIVDFRGFDADCRADVKSYGPNIGYEKDNKTQALSIGDILSKVIGRKIYVDETEYWAGNPSPMIDIDFVHQ